MTIATKFSHGGKNFVAGLIWQAQPKDVTKEDLIQLADDLGCDLMIRRDEPPVQCGFASSSLGSGIKSGLYSAAAIVSKSMETEELPSNIIAAFEIADDGYYLYSQRNHSIQPLNGDIYGTEKEILDAMKTQLTENWDMIIAPSHWNISRAVFRDFGSFIPTKNGKIAPHKWWEITPVAQKTNKLRQLLLASVVVMMAIGGYMFYDGEQKKKNRQIDLAKQQAMRAEKMKQIAQVRAPHPWASIPRSEVVAAACERALNKVPFAPAGWPQVSFVCEAGLATAIYGRPPGGLTIGSLKRAYPDAMPASAGEQAIFVRQLDIPCCEPEESLALRSETMLRLYSVAQILDFTKPTEIAVSIPRIAPDAPEQIPDWSEFGISFSAEITPLGILKSIDLPGVRIGKISFIRKSGTWTLEGKVYAQNK